MYSYSGVWLSMKMMVVAEFSNFFNQGRDCWNSAKLKNIYEKTLCPTLGADEERRLKPCMRKLPH